MGNTYEESTVRQNLMTRDGYTPYCGSETCYYRMARSQWNEKHEQFICKCGWVSQFPADFIQRYKLKWNK